MRNYLLSGLIVTLIGSAAAMAAVQSSGDWQIGPWIRAKNYSQGMPLTPEPTDSGWSFNFPYPDARAGHVHYVTFDHGSLAGKSKIVVRYRVEGARGVRFFPQEHPQLPATFSAYFQRRGDNWSAKRGYEFYRWYAPVQSMREIKPGEYEYSVSLNDPNWMSVLGKMAEVNPAEFRYAKADAGRVGLVFGSTYARGHGVFATAPAKFTLLKFEIQ